MHIFRVKNVFVIWVVYRHKIILLFILWSVHKLVDHFLFAGCQPPSKYMSTSIKTVVSRTVTSSKDWWTGAYYVGLTIGDKLWKNKYWHASCFAKWVACQYSVYWCWMVWHKQLSWGHIFSRVRPFYEQTVSNLDP